MILNSMEDTLQYIQLVKSGYYSRGKIHCILVSTDFLKIHAFGLFRGKMESISFSWVSSASGKPLQSPKEKKGDRKAGVLAGWCDVVKKTSNPPTLAEYKLEHLKICLVAFTYQVVL